MVMCLDSLRYDAIHMARSVRCNWAAIPGYDRNVNMTPERLADERLHLAILYDVIFREAHRLTDHADERKIP